MGVCKLVCQYLGLHVHVFNKEYNHTTTGELKKKQLK